MISEEGGESGKPREGRDCRKGDGQSTFCAAGAERVHY